MDVVTLLLLMTSGFSALQRAENSSINEARIDAVQNAECFSALQRAENSSIYGEVFRFSSLEGFSALQRAENSSMVRSSGD